MTVPPATISSGRPCLLAWVIALVGLLSGAPLAAEPPLLVASAEEHVWFVVKDPSRPAAWRVMHHADGMNGAYARVARNLTARPLALAAIEDRLLLVMPREAGGDASLDLIGLEVRRNDAMGNYFDLPLDAWEVYANVPASSPFAGIEYTTDLSPLVLLLPDKQVSAGVVRSGGEAAEQALPRARLLRQEGFQWTAIPLPPELHELDRQSLVPNVGLAEATILAADGDGGAVLHRLTDGDWTATSLGIQLSSVSRVIRGQDRLVLGLSDTASGLSVAVERGTTLLSVATGLTPTGTWGLASIGERILLLAVDGTGEVEVRTLDPIQGTLGEPELWERPPLDVSDWLQLPIVGMMVVAALLAIVLFRPSEAPDAPLRSGVVPMPLSRRMLALVIDFLPGILLALVLFEEDISSISTIPFWSSELAFAGPGLLVIGVTLLHELVGELVWRRSLGKWVMGGRVVASDGTRAGSRAVLLRLLFKAVVLYAPILAIFVVLSPALQGVPETVSRTVVADTRPKENLPEAE
jgi:uncharacterized RDD family membrane protein YckC